MELFQNESPFNSTRIKVVEEVLLLQYRVKMQQSSFFWRATIQILEILEEDNNASGTDFAKMFSEKLLHNVLG